MTQTLYEKIWQRHLVKQTNEFSLIYIDRHLIHEVTSPQAFAGLKANSRPVRRPELTFGTMDHSVSTRSLALDACGPVQHRQLQKLADNCEAFGITLYPVGHERQGIVHVIGPELGLVQPGVTLVCGDSHTATQGAFGALAFGIGTSEVEHVLATQTLKQTKAKTMLVDIKGTPAKGVYAKDIILAVIGKIGHAGATSHVIEYAGEAIRGMSMEGRMTICNMSIEAGAKAGLIAPDEKTFAYLKGRPFSPKDKDWTISVHRWQELKSDEGAHFDKVVQLDASKIKPQVSWGTNPGQVVGVDENVPNPDDYQDASKQAAALKALNYTQLQSGMAIDSIAITDVFIGSCTNSRIEDLREAAKIAATGKVNQGVTAIVVPGSVSVRQQAEEEGLDRIFKTAGFEWRLPGCSMCLGMNDDALVQNKRCASTSNRNFEGRQGRGSITHLVSPAMAAAAAMHGHFVDITKFYEEVL